MVKVQQKILVNDCGTCVCPESSFQKNMSNDVSTVSTSLNHGVPLIVAGIDDELEVI